jgi:Membrane protein putatively involved in post-translational modification of the autoinducing quorum-sensing peptide
VISNIAADVALFFANKNAYPHEQIASYKYGFQLMISTIISCICVVVISAFMDSIIMALLFMLSFVPLRMTAGGYHAKHHWSCIWGFNLIFFGFSLLCKYLDMRFTLIYSLFAIIFSSLMVWTFSPVEAPNKPLPDQKKIHNRNHSLIISSAGLAIVILACYSPNSPVKLLSYWASGYLAGGILLPVAYYSNKHAIKQAENG